MKKNTLLLLILLFLVFFQSNAQTNENFIKSTDLSQDIRGKQIKINNWQVHFNDDKTHSVASSSNDPKNKNTPNGNLVKIPANLSVSLSGGAVYTIPIATPPGIKNIAPNIALTFNSQSSNGIAGWGWNISGLSTISRIASSTFHDGFIDAVDFDNKDRFALDGERLIVVSGNYGASGSVYATESYSNIKIKAFGNSPYANSYGPSYFIVYYPDGSRSWYGNAGNSRGRLEWAIFKKIDPQGNFIEYNYKTTNNLKSIDTIKFGSHTTGTPPIEISFVYENRKRPELAYVGGISFKRSNILKSINVFGNNQLYRKYKLQYDETSIGYQQLTSVQEFNKNNDGSYPINFTYDTSSTSSNPDTYDGSIYPGYDYQQDEVIGGEFTGDGNMDFILDKGDKITLFGSLFSTSGINVGIEMDMAFDYDHVIPNKMLNAQGKMMSRSGITFISEELSSSDDYSNLSFKSYYKAAAGLYYQYTRTWKDHTYRVESNCTDVFYRSIPKKYVSGDFNGDGLTDVLAIDKIYSLRHCEINNNSNSSNHNTSMSPPIGCDCDNEIMRTREVHFIDLNRNLSSSNFVNLAGKMTIQFGGSDRLMAADFNGDGKTDLFHFKEGKVYIYELNTNNNLVLIHTETDSHIKMNRPILMGDYNGDGKIGFLVPTDYDSKNWKFFLSKGNSFYVYTKYLNLVTFQETKYYEDYNYQQGPTKDAIGEFKYYAQDINGDGKTDLIKHLIISAFTTDHQYSDNIVNIHLNIFNEGDSTPSFEHTSNYTQSNTGVSKFGLPIFLSPSNDDHGNFQYAYISANHISAYNFNVDHQKKMVLQQISNGGVIDEITYQPLSTAINDPAGTYSGAYNQVYPFVNLNISPSIKLVEKIEESNVSGSTVQRKKNFRYGNAVFHTKGLGFLGFEEIARTNWHGDGVSTIWSVSSFNMEKRGAISLQWKSFSPASPAYSYFSKTDYTYQTQLTANKIFINAQIEVSIENALQNITTIKSFDYDTYYNPETITTSFPGGSTKVVFGYSNNLSPFNKFYHVGRLTSKTTTKNLNGETFGSQIKNSYSNNLITQTREKGNNTGWIDTYYQYDALGNVIQKKLSTPDIADRIEHFEFDVSGRYMTNSIDIEGLETVYTYETATGNPLSVVDPFGLTTTYEYDAWQRLIQTTDYLGHQTNYSYEYIPSVTGNMLKTIDYEEGKDTKIWYNSFGWVYRNASLSLNNKWIYKDYKFDVAGRKIKESKPYFGSASPTQWNEFEFDMYGRPTKHKIYTGKTLSTSYNGLSVSVNDGTKTVTTTKDPLGNIVTLTDLGGTINYTYYANGSLKSADYGSHTISTIIDGWGRKTALHDPSAGDYTYSYNSIGELLEETTPNGSTTYQYDDFGKLIHKEISGNYTNLVLDYYYDPNTKQLITIDGTDNQVNRMYSYVYVYDDYNRPISITETTEAANFGKLFTYDGYGRLQTKTYTTEYLPGALNSTIKIKNVYDANGILLEKRKVSNNALLWKINAQNAREQALDISLGNGITKARSYDQYGFLTNITDVLIPGNTPVLKLDYDFNAQRGNLNSRKNYAFGGWEENFTYDTMDRLTHITGDATQYQDYDQKGRIVINSLVGNYTNYSNTYRIEGINLNDQGDLYYQQHALQTVTYNAFKKPIEIYEEGYGRASFEYGPLMNRTRAYYGGLETDKTQRRYHKYYSSIIPVEIVEDTDENQLKIITYVGGSAYTAPIVHIKEKESGNTSADYYYLHRDYLGSILAISDANGNSVEQRHFGAWGQIEKYWSSAGLTTFSHESLLSRGFTGHEHFFGVSLIHMNGRMYDAHLRRFLSPDNYIQAPYSTQSFNRFGYVWNNPLKYSDASGEFLLAAVLIGAAVGAYLGGVQANGGSWNPTKWSWDAETAIGMIGGAVIGGISGAAGAAVGGSVAGLLAASGGAIQGGIIGGFISGAAGGMIGGAISGFGMALLPGGSGNTLRGMARGAVMGAAMGGIIGGAIGGFTTPKGYNIWTGTKLRPTPMTTSKLTPHSITKNLDVQEAIPDTGPIHYKANYSTKVMGADGAHNWNRATIEIVADNGKIFKHMYQGRPQTLIQMSGNRFGQEGIFELVIEKGVIQHQMFVPNGVINGIPNYINATFKGLNFGVNWFNIPNKNPLIPNWQSIIKP